MPGLLQRGVARTVLSRLKTALPPQVVATLLARTPERLRTRLLGPRPDWSIGLLEGDSLLGLAPLPDTVNPVLRASDVTDVTAGFLADPFALRTASGWHLFFEVLNTRTGKGEIGLATSPDARTWRYERIVLAEPFHLSYPYVFTVGDIVYMVPETYQSRAVSLYRATKFPYRWEPVGPLLRGGVFLDSCVVHHDGRWWIFTETDPSHRYDTLRLFHAEDLDGPFVEHPSSPVVARDPAHARPGGRVVTVDGRLVRFAQDCAEGYGRLVHAFEITTLTPTGYAERSIGTVLAAGSADWNRAGMHHIDAHRTDDGRWLAFVDGQA